MAFKNTLPYLLAALVGLSACGGTGSPEGAGSAIDEGVTLPGEAPEETTTEEPTSSAQGVTVAVQPTAAEVVAGTPVAFTATVDGTPSTGVTWSIAEGNATVDAAGVFSAAEPGTYYVVATSTVDPAATAAATVTVAATAAEAGGAGATAATVVVYPTPTTPVRRTQPAMAEPPLGGTRSFSDLGTIVTRVSDKRHHYAKTSVWNNDESLAITLDGSVLDGQSYQHIRSAKGSIFPNEHRTWSNTDRRYIYGVKTPNQWVRVDATAPANNRVIATFSQYSKVSYGSYEGNMDNADTGVVLIGNGTRPFLVNPKTGALRCTVTSGGGYGRTVSDTTISQDGQWILVNWSGYGVDAYRASDCRFHRRLTSATGHYDACVSTAGQQVIVQLSAANMVRISDGVTVDVFKPDSSVRGHLSCRNIKRPGWAYVSIYNDTCDTYQKNMVSFHRIYAVKLDGSQKVENYAWDHEACPSYYDDDTMAVPSPLGNRVWWKVNWDGKSSGIHSFVAEK